MLRENGLKGTATTEEEVKQKQDEDKVETAAPVITPAGTRIVSAAANQKDHDDEKNNHGGESSTRTYFCALRGPMQIVSCVPWSTADHHPRLRRRYCRW
jgi:hypothetical protein